MLAYNGSIPGPTLKIPEGATVTVHVTNEGDLEATVHWHGLRLENRYDGTHDTQAPIPVGETFTYEVHVPDPGAYWYHPHIREDYGQEMGLYGNIHVVPADPDYWPPVNRELFLTLDDVLIEDGKIAGFSASETTHVAMGRFGNVMLVSGEPDLALTAKRGEVVRFYFTNTANTRVFNVTLPGARMKLVGGDSGHYEHESFVEEVLLSPSERFVVDVLFEQPGEHVLEHRTPARSYRLASITVTDEASRAARSREQFAILRTNDDLAAERRANRPIHERCSGQDARLRRRDGLRHARGRRLHVSDASERRQRGARTLPRVRNEAPSGRGSDELRLPDASTRHQRLTRPLSRVRHEAHAGTSCRHRPSTLGTTCTRLTTSITTTVHTRHTRALTTPPTATSMRRASSGKTTWSK